MKIVPRKGKFKIRFDSMTPAQRRVAIAKDVLVQVKAGKYNPKFGSYVESDAVASADPGTPLHKVVLAKDFECQVCALGSMCLSAAAKFDSMELTHYEKDYGISGNHKKNDKQSLRFALERYFTQDQLELIESAFEATTMSEGYADNGHIIASRMLRGSTKTRLVKIMENIIANKGTFVVPSE